MGSSFDTKTLVVNLGDPGGDDALLVLRAPTAEEGGGITILGAYAVNHAATNGGTSFSLALHKYTNAGTPAVSGTIAPPIGGTSDPWASAVPKSFTIDGDHARIDAGEWLAIDYTEQTSGSPTNGFVTIHYQLGV